MSIPRNRREAKGTKYEPLFETPSHWPDNVRIISVDGFDNMGLDPDNRLYWDGVPIVTKRTISLEGWSLTLAVIATVATVMTAIWPIGVHYSWWPIGGTVPTQSGAVETNDFLEKRP